MTVRQLQAKGVRILRIVYADLYGIQRGKDILLGVVDVGSETVETPETVAERLHKAMRYADPGHLLACTDCGMVPRSRTAAEGKMRSLAQGAALGVNYLTAWRMLFTKAKLQPGETVLVCGIGGGVSFAALQIAKAAGARVIAAFKGGSPDIESSWSRVPDYTKTLTEKWVAKRHTTSTSPKRLAAILATAKARSISYQ